MSGATKTGPNSWYYRGFTICRNFTSCHGTGHVCASQQGFRTTPMVHGGGGIAAEGIERVLLREETECVPGKVPDRDEFLAALDVAADVVRQAAVGEGDVVVTLEDEVVDGDTDALTLELTVALGVRLKDDVALDDALGDDVALSDTLDVTDALTVGELE
jgi:hypothetical protein